MVTEEQILEEFMLEEEIEFQGIDKCKIVEVPDEQDIEKCIDIEKYAVSSSEMTVRIAYEQEECIEEENCDRSLLKLPKLYRAEESIHKDKMKLETCKINAVEINGLSREVKLGMLIEQSESKLDVNLFNDMPIPDQAEHEIHYPMRSLTCVELPLLKFQYHVERFWVDQYQSYTMYQNYTLDRGRF